MNTTTSLQQRRASVGLSQAALGKILGWTQTRVSMFERTAKDLTSPQARAYLSAVDRLAKQSNSNTKGPKTIRRRGAKSPKPIKPRTTRVSPPANNAELTFQAALRLPGETPGGVALGKIAEIVSIANAALPKGWEFSITDIKLR